ncbi:palmitoleoyl-protein carboxylesterase NOTUM isoform X2 [Lepeophtheirus salmonis]|uniref:palmitoleoyl-protein carboxylesterase NOTUM isoform X2 n=1 Tax=Lepeophtheirus salmonis TaxID=72036 RepID=UPI001AE84139|nr:palmitoleoyl-protein carboxylesterase notum1-like isoform X2 [Lepeophtheirus salmonis]
MWTQLLGPTLTLLLCGLFQAQGWRIDSSSNETPQSLPPDTFRKLAQALYQRGDKAENRLSKKIFYNRNITCNDGSPAGYYMRRNSRSRRWVIFLEGGWYCYDNISCESRWIRLRSLMSSERWPSVKTVGGILSSDVSENPHFSDANHILIPYCSSDSWSGTSKMGETNSRFAFMGAYIIQEVINELVYYEKLLQGSELYLSGSSAGGTGVLINVDSVAESIKRFGRNELVVRGISDSGWFLDSNPFSPRSDGCDEEGNCSPIGAVRKGTHLWKAKVHSKCKESFGQEIANCFFGYKVYPLIKSPLFIFQWQFDEAQMIADNVGAPVTKAQWNFIHRMGDQLRDSFNNVTAVFSPACISHSVLTKRNWISIEVDGVTLPDALNCWIKHLSSSSFSYSKRFKNTVPDQVKVNVISPLSKRGISSMLADAPRFIYSTKDRYKKVTTNLIPSVSIPPTEDNFKNTISNRLKTQKNKSSTSSSEKRGKKSLSSKRKRRNRNVKRRRLRKLRQKCKRHNDAACVEFFKPINSEIVKSLDRRSSRRQGKQHVHKRKNHKKSQRKKKKKKKRRNNKRRRRRRERKARRQARKLKPRSVLYNQSTGPPLKTYTAHKKCLLRHVDTCSWPQCNRSCPKLRNPATGEEMDFLELLKSFGLDMKNVARALGVDYATLKDMDKDVLLHLLTSQPNS